MDAPAPDNIAAEEGGQQQMHQDDKEHRPMFRRVKDRMRKMKNTIAGHGHDHDHDHEQDTGGGDSNSTGEDEEDAATREAEVDKGGYQQQDVEDKPIFADSSPEQHGAPMYDSERIPAAAKEVEHNDAPAAAQEVKRDDAAGMRLGDLGGPPSAKEVKLDDTQRVPLGDLGAPAAAQEVKRDDAPGVWLGDLGAPAAAQEVKPNEAPGVRLADLGAPAAAQEVKRDDTQGVPLGDLGSPVVEDPAVPNSSTPMPPGGQDIGTTDAVRNLEAMTVSDDPKQVGARKMDVDVSKEYEAMPVSDGTGEERNDAPTDAEYTGSDTDRLKNTAAGTVYEKVAGVGTVMASKAQLVTPGVGAGGNAQDDSSATAAPESVTAGAGKRDLDLPQEGTRASYTGTEGLKNAATDATTEGAPGATYTDMIKSAAAGTTEYGKKLASTVYDMIKSAVAGTTEYGKKLASTVYEKVAGVATAVASKAQQVTTSAGTAVLHGAAPRTNTNVM
ncbi:low-temperature-induced 65 kDa protein-like isoform X1 [Triticum dicoccoides]|uniref:low-temperature-induced 65 kDa protein-like isoform X1 n=1 Tax=Triticum dicoccoides TaxID=85692 RepID=UPI001891BE76|nr:low-temperature-induced 65 kDa protein-like isoform X1 [Triticum dicoccoides]